MYKYSDGTIRNAVPFTYNEVQYGIDVFTKWTPAQLAEVGVKEFIEDSVAEGFWGGSPLDIETATSIHRTYPDPFPIEKYWENKRKAAILIELSALDVFVPRSVEEMFEANPDVGLSDINKQRIADKITLRAELAAMGDN